MNLFFLVLSLMDKISGEVENKRKRKKFDSIRAEYCIPIVLCEWDIARE